MIRSVVRSVPGPVHSARSVEGQVIVVAVVGVGVVNDVAGVIVNVINIVIIIVIIIIVVAVADDVAVLGKQQTTLCGVVL